MPQYARESGLQISAELESQANKQRAAFNKLKARDARIAAYLQKKNNRSIAADRHSTTGHCCPSKIVKEA